MQEHLSHGPCGLVTVDLRLREPQLQERQQAGVQRGESDDRVSDGEPTGSDALLHITLGSKHERSPAGRDSAEPAVAENPHDLRARLGHAGTEPDAAGYTLSGIIERT